MTIQRVLPAVALFAAAAAVPAWAAPITYTGAETTYTVPTAGLYDILAIGGGGGSGFAGNIGGRGAVVEDTFSLTAGEQLDVLVGGVGGNASDGPAAAAGGRSWSPPAARRC